MAVEQFATQNVMIFTPRHDMQPPTVAAIIPAYNEAGRIGKVVEVVCQVGMLGEILIIDDGSDDETGAEALRAAQGDRRVRVVRHAENQGKGEAIFSGLNATRARYVLLVDADLINLHAHHLHDLIAPVLSGDADMTLGLFEHGYWRTDMAHRLTPWLSGQRCVRADLLRDLPREAAAGYGFETALTVAAQQGGWRCQEVPLPGVSHVPGDIPRGWRGPWNKAQMYAQILRAWLLANPAQVARPLLKLAAGVGLVYAALRARRRC